MARVSPTSRRENAESTPRRKLVRKGYSQVKSLAASIHNRTQQGSKTCGSCGDFALGRFGVQPVEQGGVLRGDKERAQVGKIGFRFRLCRHLTLTEPQIQPCLRRPRIVRGRHIDRQQHTARVQCVVLQIRALLTVVSVPAARAVVQRMQCVRSRPSRPQRFRLPEPSGPNSVSGSHIHQSAFHCPCGLVLA